MIISCTFFFFSGSNQSIFDQLNYISVSYESKVENSVTFSFFPSEIMHIWYSSTYTDNNENCEIDFILL